MRKVLTFATALAFSATAAQAQTVATFDTLSLPGTDTFYVNYSNPGQDVGFDDGLAHFECVYDTTFGFKSLTEGFVYSNMTDSVDGSYLNPNSAKTATGYNNSPQYLVAFAYNGPISVTLKGKAKGQPVNGFYATNNTYAYEIMENGDGFGFAKKFGDSTNAPDWFKLTVKGYLNGTQTTDTVDFYLADYRFADSTKDYIVKTWEWVDLLPLGEVDSLTFSLSSTDTGQFGMNTPGYFCMDDFKTFETSDVTDTRPAYAAKVYPNPAGNLLVVELNDRSVKELVIMDAAGRMIARYDATDRLTLNIGNYTPGVYLLNMRGEQGTAVARFVKQ